MVQIKLNIYLSSRSLIVLYIPHGSDKTADERCPYRLAGNLYIPHGSDKTDDVNFVGRALEALYPTWFR